MAQLNGYLDDTNACQACGCKRGVGVYYGFDSPKSILCMGCNTRAHLWAARESLRAEKPNKSIPPATQGLKDRALAILKSIVGASTDLYTPTPEEDANKWEPNCNMGIAYERILDGLREAVAAEKPTHPPLPEPIKLTLHDNQGMPHEVCLPVNCQTSPGVWEKIEVLFNIGKNGVEVSRTRFLGG